MSDQLKKLYFTPDDDTLKSCKGCEILEKSKDFFCRRKVYKTTDVVFISESYTFNGITFEAFSDEIVDFLKRLLPNVSFQCIPAIKCPDVKDGDIDANSVNICRPYVYEDIVKINPKLIFVCGQLAMKTVLKKQGIKDKRGKEFQLDIDGKIFNVMPIFHPHSVLIEPKNNFLFQMDIRNGINKFIFDIKKKIDRTFEFVDTEAKFCKMREYFEQYKGPISIDIETTGLDFKIDLINTIGLVTDEEAFVIPIEHKDFSWGFETCNLILHHLMILLGGDNEKVLQNGKFDRKFLRRYGIELGGHMFDTEVVAHILDEERPSNLKDLVKTFFPSELERL